VHCTRDLDTRRMSVLKELVRYASLRRGKTRISLLPIRVCSINILAISRYSL